MNIYVANLNYKVQDENLRELFEEYGEVSSAKVISDRETGKSRGFGFVEMPDENDALTAIEELDGVEIEGRVIKVNKARPRAEGGNAGGGGRRFSNQRY
ncbi:MAG: RNA recognition motif domain-containing protein [Cyclobacteriaceae bacterium]